MSPEYMTAHIMTTFIIPFIENISASSFYSQSCQYQSDGNVALIKITSVLLELLTDPGP